MHHDLSLRLRFHYSYEIFEIADISQFCPFHHNDPHPQTWLGAKLAAATCTRGEGGVLAVLMCLWLFVVFAYTDINDWALEM